MYCKKCGAEIDDEAVVCPKCGCAVDKGQQNPKYNESKTGMGVLMGLFLGLIGLIIGIFSYPEGTVARKTFIKAWLITFLICLVVSFIIGLVVFENLYNMIDTYNY